VSAGYIVFAHGSRIETANEAVRQVAARMARAGGFEHVEAAFLELGQPSLEGAVARLSANGVRRVLVIPYFLTLGLHLERDLPKLVAEAAAAHPDVTVETAPPLDGHQALVEILLDRARGR
jgi:sirohydrochlorin ferrochelatase